MITCDGGIRINIEPPRRRYQIPNVKKKVSGVPEGLRPNRTQRGEGGDGVIIYSPIV